MAEDATGVRNSIQSISYLLEKSDPNLPLLLSQTGLAIRQLSGLFSKHPVLASDIDAMGEALVNLRLRFTPEGEAL